MNSVIITWLCGFWRVFVGIFTKSGLYAAFIKIYERVSSWWNNGMIVGFLKRDDRFGMERHSILYKLTRLPFGIVEYIEKYVGAKLKQIIDDSFFVGCAKAFMNNALALNTRFIGCIVLAAAISYELLRMSVSVPMAAVFTLGFVLLLTDRNITEFFEGSKLVTFCLKSVGFGKVDWNFYDVNDLKKTKALAYAVLVGIASGVLGTVSPVLGLALPIGIIGIFTVFAYPIVGVAAAVAATPFVPTMVLAGLCVLTFGSLIVKALTTNGFKWKFDSTGMMLIAFLIFMLVSSLFSFSPKKSILVWGMYLIFIGFYFVIINTADSEEKIHSILKLFVLAGALVCLYGAMQYVFGWNTSNAWIDEDMFEQATMRAYSTMENPNVFGEYLLLLIPLSAVFMLKKSPNKLTNLIYAGIFLLSLLCMVFTQSRGCWLGLILTAMIFVTFYHGKLWGLLPLVLIVLPFVIPETMTERMMSIGNTEDSSTSYRVFIWLGTFEMLKDFWVGGIGMGEGAFRSVYPLYSYNAIIAPHSHNTFLQLLVEGGIGALLIFLSFVTVVLRKLYMIYGSGKKSGYKRLFALAIGSGICGFLLQSMFDYTFYNYRMMAMFFMIIALGVSLGNVKEETYD